MAQREAETAQMVAARDNEPRLEMFVLSGRLETFSMGLYGRGCVPIRLSFPLLQLMFGFPSRVKEK